MLLKLVVIVVLCRIFRVCVLFVLLIELWNCIGWLSVVVCIGVLN